VWLPAALLKQQDFLANTLFASTRHFEVQLHFNKGLAGAPEDKVAAARDTAINPAVLDAFALALIAGFDPHTAPGLLGHEPDLAAGRKAAVAITACADELRAIAPVAGAIASERPAATALFPLLSSVLTDELLTFYPCAARE
jgi:hypothetical protein